MTPGWTFLREHLQRLQGPDTLLYWPYVVSAWLLTVGFSVAVAKRPLGDAVRGLFARHVWLTRSTRTDVVMTLIHEAFVAAPTLALSAYVSDRLLLALERHALPVGAPHWAAPPLLQSIVVTCQVMLAVDLGTFVAHRLHHAFPVLWEIHAVHHSAEQLTFFTAHRLHPLESFLRSALQGVLSGMALALADLTFGGVAPAISIAGVGAGFFVFSFTNNLLHSHVPVRYPKWLRRWVLSPHIHHLHHSRAAAHYDRNFGAIFPYWDRLCRTYLDVEFESGEIPFGLDEVDDPFHHSIVRCYLYPIVAPLLRLRRRLPPGRRRRDTTLTPG
jgi:sterol desaturase/sphingolipid hydroxylase (fatty acid hydroxylase superfamily)